MLLRQREDRALPVTGYPSTIQVAPIYYSLSPGATRLAFTSVAVGGLVALELFGRLALPCNRLCPTADGLRPTP